MTQRSVLRAREQATVRVGGAVIGLTVDGDPAVLSHDIYHRQVETTDQIGDGAMAGGAGARLVKLRAEVA